jgi:hypothetical protein
VTVFEKIESSELWDKRYGLPLIPRHSNPFIYCAYVFKLAKYYTDPSFPDLKVEWEASALEYSALCNVAGNGYFRRWPDGGGGTFSHDEMIGAAYLNRLNAASIGYALLKNDGIYDSDSEAKNVFRFLFLMPYLKARAGFKVSLPSQILWSAHVVTHALRYNEKTGDSGTLKIWLMAEEMIRFPICKLAYSFWRSRMLKKGRTLKKIFSTSYLTEFPILAEIAPEDI